MQTSYSLYHQEGQLGTPVYNSPLNGVKSGLVTEAVKVGRGISKVRGKIDQFRYPVANKSTVTADADFVALNVINMKVNGSAITPVTFTTDHATTMGLIATAIAAKTSYVASATVSAARVITVTAVEGVTLAITDIAVTLGLSQPGVTFAAGAGGTYDNLDGIVLKTQSLESGLPNTEEETSYAAKDVVNIARQGTYFVYFETAFTPGTDTLYLRHTANGTGKEPGQFLNSADSGKAVAVTGNFEVIEPVTVAGIGKLEINKPV